jgi:hypothetical protein
MFDARFIGFSWTKQVHSYMMRCNKCLKAIGSSSSRMWNVLCGRYYWNCTSMSDMHLWIFLNQTVPIWMFVIRRDKWLKETRSVLQQHSRTIPNIHISEHPVGVHNHLSHSIIEDAMHKRLELHADTFLHWKRQIFIYKIHYWDEAMFHMRRSRYYYCACSNESPHKVTQNESDAAKVLSFIFWSIYGN